MKLLPRVDSLSPVQPVGVVIGGDAAETISVDGDRVAQVPSAAIPGIEEAARFRPLLLTAIFTGLRASELRGLKWADVDLKLGEVHVRQRADRYGKIGRTKSEAGERVVPLPPMVVAVLREHRLACPNVALGLVFPNTRGGIDHRHIIVERGHVTLDGVVNNDMDRTIARMVAAQFDAFSVKNDLKTTEEVKQDLEKL